MIIRFLIFSLIEALTKYKDTVQLVFTLMSVSFLAELIKYFQELIVLTTNN